MDSHINNPYKSIAYPIKAQCNEHTSRKGRTVQEIDAILATYEPYLKEVGLQGKRNKQNTTEDS